MPDVHRAQIMLDAAQARRVAEAAEREAEAARRAGYVNDARDWEDIAWQAHDARQRALAKRRAARSG